MVRIPAEPQAFSKWDPEGTHTTERKQASALLRGDPSPDAAAQRQRAKRWVLRWAWALSTGVIVIGYVIMIAALTGHLDWFHLAD